MAMGKMFGNGNPHNLPHLSQSSNIQTCDPANRSH